MFSLNFKAKDQHYLAKGHAPIPWVISFRLSRPKALLSAVAKCENLHGFPCRFAVSTEPGKQEDNSEYEFRQSTSSL